MNCGRAPTMETIFTGLVIWFRTFLVDYSVALGKGLLDGAGAPLGIVEPLALTKEEVDRYRHSEIRGLPIRRG